MSSEIRVTREAYEHFRELGPGERVTLYAAPADEFRIRDVGHFVIAGLRTEVDVVDPGIPGRSKHYVTLEPVS